MIVLDTHALMWAVDAPDRLSGRAAGALETADEVVVSAMSAWELGMLEARERVQLSLPAEEWLDLALATLEARLVDVDFEVALSGARLMRGALDPADSMIAGTALAFDAAVVSADRVLAKVADLQVIW